MVTPIMSLGDSSAIGSHIFIYDGPNGIYYAHNGSIGGYRSEMRYYPALDITITMWTNTSGDKPAAIWSALTNTVSGLVLNSTSN
jgi:hypothetical protein